MIINPNYPYIGASPDATVECKCCGIRCLEIKCPYSHRGDSIPQMLGKKSYLHKNAEGKVQLMSNNSYYYQVQTQLLITDKSQDKWRISKMSDDEDDLIMCESKTCKIQWFHIKRMRIKKIPKGKWFCVKCKTKKKTIEATKNS